MGTAPVGGTSRTWLPCTQKRPIRCGVKLAATRASQLLVASGASIEATLLAGLETAVEETSELLTVYLGADAPSDGAELVRSIIEGAYPRLSVEVVEGGQPYYPYVVGVE